MNLAFRNCEDFASADMLIGLVRANTRPDWLRYFDLDGVPGLEDVREDQTEPLILYPGTGKARRLCLVSLGKDAPQTGNARADLLARLRKALATASHRARALRADTLAFAVDSLKELGLPDTDLPLLLHESVYALHLDLYQYLELKNDPHPHHPSQLELVASTPFPEAQTIGAAALAEAQAVCLARDLVNTPANLLPPLAMADKARELSAGLPLTCSTLDSEHLENEGLNALLAVGRSSANEPVLVILEYAPEGHEQDDPLVLLGKGLAFDSGGISLKPAAGMHEMKSDMAGAAAVLAAMTLIARQGGSRRVIGLLPCAENMPDAGAIKPGDVVRTLKGTTVEVINTDAEGRLVLCDALTYAQKRWKPACMVDVATLTGACVVALGTQVAGLFANNAGLSASIVSAGLERGERFWPMPVWDLYAEKLKSPAADLSNVGPREGGAVTAALFLKHFVEDCLPWAHLDIAGTAFDGKVKNGSGGATGFGVRTLAALAGLRNNSRY